ncbi:MAG: ATP synthase F1 subunit gamma [Gemmataceae bacterium]|nr:ATP synthase F1 subunit gamma [Gemmataceae bacterium]
MANTRALVKRRKAVRNIRKITRTMELIATARFKKAQDRASEAAAYTRKIAELAADLSATAGTVTHPLLQKRDTVKNAVLLVLSSNRGLCGGYNAAILREANNEIKRLTESGVRIHLDLSGKRALTYFKYQGTKPENAYTNFEDKPAFAEVEPIADRYIKAFIAGDIDRVEVAYMKYINAAVQRPVVEVLLPLDAAPAKDKPAEKKKPVQYDFYPEAEGILAQLLPESFKVRLFKCFLDAAVSEQIARRVTMKQATENAGDMIKAISQEYNRARQAGITKEILEIVGGAEALR